LQILFKKMSNAIIKVENLGKSYLIGHEREKGYVALRDVVANKAKNFAKGIKDTIGGKQLMGDQVVEEFWALKDVSFEINQGDTLGVIGRNGAGKSTLLKILSRITEPTKGKITLNGRIASLLEVGTGFHPELTGRENIYLNGAILGMSRAEIKRKFDEIVDFSGVERFLDTPVKRYSSGMYVRLAFAVAAHLESEILVVDEVLAVGDAEFQKKCLGKMGEVSKGDGRTVLFVSHNMAAIENLCKKSILLQNGSLVNAGNTSDIISYYVSRQHIENKKLSDIITRKGNKSLFFTDGLIEGIETDEQQAETFKSLRIKLSYKYKQEVPLNSYKIDIGINNHFGDRVGWLSTKTIENDFNLAANDSIEFVIQNLPFGPGDYTCNIYSEINNEVADWLESVLAFTIKEKDYYNTGKLVPANQGNILLKYKIV